MLSPTDELERRLAYARNMLERWIEAWKHGAQTGISTSALAHESTRFLAETDPRLGRDEDTREGE